MIVEAKDIGKRFGALRALQGVSLSIPVSGMVGLCGESGSGKSTLARIIAGLLTPSEGSVSYDHTQVGMVHRDVQIVFQNPFASLNPKMRIGAALEEPLRIHGLARGAALRQRTRELLAMVGLDDGALTRFPREFSGGQRQRICIARALATRPKLLILDEPISSLDLTVQAAMVKLFIELHRTQQLAYLFISHNLAVLRHVCDRIAVLKAGKLVEQADTAQILASPTHPYTQELLSAARQNLPKH